MARALWEWYLQTALEIRGVKTRGEVEQRYKRKYYDTNRTPLYFVVFRFSLQGTDFRYKQRVNRHNYFELCPGDSVPVVHLRENPKLARLVGPIPDNTQRNFASWNALLAVSAWVLVFAYFYVVR